MARSKTDDFLILQLGIRRSTLAREIRDAQRALLPELQADFDETEAKLIALDPDIRTLAQEEEAQIALVKKAADDAAAEKEG